VHAVFLHTQKTRSYFEENMGSALSTRRNIPCPESYGICVVVSHGLFLLSDYKASKLHVYSLIDGTLLRSIGSSRRSEGNGKRQYDCWHYGLCASPDGDSVLVAERGNNCVQEARIADGSWVRFIGIGVLKEPEFVDCNADVIAVSELGSSRISVLSWADGSVRSRFGKQGSHPGQLKYPMGVRLLADGGGLAVADSWNHRLCVFTLNGEFVAKLGGRAQGLDFPRDVTQCASDGSCIVANCHGYKFIKLSRDGVMAEMYGKRGVRNGEFNDAGALVALPNDGCFVVDARNRRVQYLAHLRARLAWMRACARCIV
jgi:hypothetical protein